jgi:hypothetical protein
MKEPGKRVSVDQSILPQTSAGRLSRMRAAACSGAEKVK